MRVGIVAGVVVANDAISAAAAGQARLFADMPGVDAVTIFAQSIGRDVSCDARRFTDSWSLTRDAEFAACDFVIFHWGIHYALFDALTLFSPERRRRAAVHFHNCTPIDLVHDDHRAHIELSMAQLAHTIGLGVPFWTYSEFNKRTLLEWGADEEQIAFVPFPIDVPTGLAAVRSTDRIDLVSVGRFVPAKGQLTLVEALSLLSSELRHTIRLHMAGSATFSDLAYYAELRTRIEQPDIAGLVTIIDDPSDAELWELYASSHIVVSTSLHEGLCVPIIEGYAVGCRAIGTTEGNLPFVVIAPDEVVAPSDPALLAAAIERAALGWNDTIEAYEEDRSLLVRSFSSDSCRELMRSIVFADLAVS